MIKKKRRRGRERREDREGQRSYYVGNYDSIYDGEKGILLPCASKGVNISLSLSQTERRQRVTTVCHIHLSILSAVWLVT